MTRLIDADMCIAKIKGLPVTYDSETVQRCIEIVSNAPTIEQKGETMDDLINRQAAIEALLDKGQSSRRYKLGEIWELNFDEIREVLNSLPSAEPKKGKWEMKPDPFGFFDEIPVCSECGCTTKMRDKTKYCPHCGAKMEVEHETD